MNLENIKMVAMDLDGTLLKSDKSIDEATLNELNRIIEKGIIVVPITGRPLAGIPNNVKNIKGIKYVICTNGAVTYDLIENKVVREDAINKDLSNSIMKELDERDIDFEAFSGGYGYIRNETLEKYNELFGNTALGSYIRESRIPVDNVYQSAKDKDDIVEIFVLASDKDSRDNILCEMSKHKELTVCPLIDTHVEITSKSVDKGKSLIKLCEMLGIEVCDVLAFGDGENDLSFLKIAGISVAMGNAVDQVKDIADIVTSSNDCNGITQVIVDL